MRTSVVLSILCATSASFALPNPDTRFRDGANHHVGDDSFLAAHGRAPDGADTEKQRMKTHLVHVRAWLASRPATAPALEKRRAELLGYLDDYIAKGITPRNEHLPWRAPVFIDDHSAICAVGYLIERSTPGGRALPEKIAREHRYEFLEDIAQAMPDVRAWVAASGFTLVELASIQPAYSSPNIEQWRTWDLVRHAPKDGPFEDKRVTGAFLNKTLHGTWTVKAESDRDGDSDVIVGRGNLVRGNGTWKSYYKDGKTLLATGPYRNSKANGDWTFYHPSGNVAAKGKLVDGMRRGEWSFYYDTAKKTPIAIGRFLASGGVTGVWRHFDADGKLLARTYREAGDITEITADASGVTERSHAFMDPPGPIDGRAQRLTQIALGAERIYIHDSGFAKDDVMYDAAGFKLEHADGTWTAADCKWSARRKQVAKTDNIAWLNKMLFAESYKRSAKDTEYGIRIEEDTTGPTCGTPKPIANGRAARLDKLIASREAVRAPNPAFIREIILNQEPDAKLVAKDEPDVTDTTYTTDTVEPADDESRTMRGPSGAPLADDNAWKKDLRAFVRSSTIDLVEWPHIDGRFERVFRTMAGHYRWEWAGSEPEADGTNPLQNNARRR